jgi:hypothetical protein
MHSDQIAGRDPEYKPRFLNGEPNQRRRRAGDATARAAALTADAAGTTHHATTLLLTAELALAAGERRVAVAAAGDALALLEDPEAAPGVRARLRAVVGVLAARGPDGVAGRPAVAGPAGD